MVPQDDPGDLVRDGAVHRRVYADPALFALEQERLFRRAWLYVGHESEVPNEGDFVLTRLGPDEVILVRQPDRRLALLHNRCAHRGARVLSERSGSLRRFRCPYHAWTYRLDGSLIGVPLPAGYGTELDQTGGGVHLARVPRIASHRGFIFGSHAERGEDLESFLGGLASALDNMVDRSPAGTLTQMGGKLRIEYRGNWKLFMENATDLVHPGFVHESSIAAARACPQPEAAADGTSQTVQMLLSNGLAVPQWDDVPLRAFRNGHVYMGGFYRQGVIAPHREDAVFERYCAALVARHGEKRTAEILAVDRFNNLIWPNLSVNSRFAVLRQITPIAVDRTVVTSCWFRFDGAPEEMLDLTLQFLNTASSAASMVASDDVEIFERCQRGLGDSCIDWIDIKRGMLQDRRIDGGTLESPGTSELAIRNQLAAWKHYMRAEP
jgi:phenylpropionate dioxygenase-like ring-hydroxylating dioxygenase large terminal subunit